MHHGVTSRVLVVDDDGPRSRGVCAFLEGAGYRATASSDADEIGRLLDDDGSPTVVLVDINSSCGSREASERHIAIERAVAGRCPIVLFGDRMESTASEAPPSGRPVRRKVRSSLLDLLSGLLPEPELPMEASTEAEEKSERPTSPVTAPKPVTVEPQFPPSGEESDKPPPVSGAAAKGSRGSVSGEWERVRLLLIDDSEITLELMQASLRAEGADVRIALALAEVDSIVANWCPNLIVANVKRTDLSGDALCARLKRAVGSAELRILLCSTLPDDELRLLSLAAGADGYVSKSRGLDSFVREVVELTLKLTPPNLGRTKHA